MRGSLRSKSSAYPSTGCVSDHARASHPGAGTPAVLLCHCDWLCLLSRLPVHERPQETSGLASFTSRDCQNWRSLCITTCPGVRRGCWRRYTSNLRGSRRRGEKRAPKVTAGSATCPVLPPLLSIAAPQHRQVVPLAIRGANTCQPSHQTCHQTVATTVVQRTHLPAAAAALVPHWRCSSPSFQLHRARLDVTAEEYPAVETARHQSISRRSTFAPRSTPPLAIAASSRSLHPSDVPVS